MELNKKQSGGFLQALALILAACIFNTNTSSFIVIIESVASHFAPMGMQSTQVSLLQTLPSLFMIPAVFGGGFLKSRFSQKTLTMFGWGLYGCFGLLLMFIDHYILFIIVRACMGFGLGIALPQPKAIVAKLYDGEKRASLIGYISMVGGVISLLISISLGYVAAVNWRFALLLYPVFAIVVIVLVGLFVPHLPPENFKATAAPGEKKEPLNKFVWALIIAGFFSFIICSVIQVKTGQLVQERGFGGSVETGWVSACATLGTFTGGLTFGRLYKTFGRWMLCISAVCAAVGYFVLASAPVLVVAFIGSYLCGLGSVGTINPYLVARISFVAPKSRKSDAITYITASTYGGQFFGTLYLTVVQALFGPSASAALMSVSGSFIIMLVIAFLFMTCTKKQSAELAKINE